jgi:transcriptional adapter 2-alpha
VDFKKQQQQERKRTKEERDLVARLRIFARFQTAEEHEAMVDGLIKARKLRSQIALYQHYRRMGVRTLEQGRAYEVERKKRETELKAQKQRQQTPYLFQPPAGAAAGSTAAATAATAAAASSQSSTSDAAAGGGGNLLDGAVGGRRRGPGQGEERGSKRSADDAAAIISKAPGFELLAPKEAELCVAVPMLPMHFLAAKEALVREAYRNGSLTLEGMNRVIKLETPKAAEVYDFFVRETGLGGEGAEVAVGVGRPQ